MHCDGGIFESMELIKDIGRIPSGEYLLADIPDPCRPVGQHRQLLGFEHAVPEPEPLQPTGELRCPAGPVHRLRAVDADASRPAALVLPRRPGHRILAVRPVADDDLRLAGLRRAVRLLAGHALALARDHRNAGAVDPARTRSAEGASGSKAYTSSPTRMHRRRRVAFVTFTPARFPSLRTAAS